MTADTPAPDSTPIAPQAIAGGLEARAVLLGERIDVRGFGPPDVVALSPLAFRPPTGGLVAVYRFGAIVFVGVDAAAQEQTITALGPRVVDPASPQEIEVLTLVAASGSDDALVGAGKIALTDFTEARLLIVADALAKSVALADDERYLRKVFELIEPFAQNLAATGEAALSSRSLLKLLGEALVAQARMVGRVEVQEKPDLLWDRPDLQRLYARLADEYELDERARALSRKLKVVEECASTLSDVTDSTRTLRLEIAVVALIAFEIVLSLLDITGVIH